jgi:hypothetical protein
MKRTTLAGRLAAAALALAGVSDARADWLAVDPGTPVSVQINPSGGVVIEPIGGTWSHAVCSDVTAAVLRATPKHASADTNYDLLLDILITAAANGSLVNLNTLTDSCHAAGYPLVIAVKIQGP